MSRQNLLTPVPPSTALRSNRRYTPLEARSQTAPLTAGLQIQSGRLAL